MKALKIASFTTGDFQKGDLIIIFSKSIQPYTVNRVVGLFPKKNKLKIKNETYSGGSMLLLDKIESPNLMKIEEKDLDKWNSWAVEQNKMISDKAYNWKKIDIPELRQVKI